MNEIENKFLDRAITLSREGMKSLKGGPFGCVIVKDGVIIGEGSNEVTTSNDPTAHAEIVAIRNACKTLNNFQLDDCDIYCSCEPCPMCFGAIYWARPRRVIFANTKEDAAGAGFDDAFIYEEMKKGHTDKQIQFIRVSNESALDVFREWKEMEGKQVY